MSNRNFKHGSRALEKVLKANALDRRTGTAREFTAIVGHLVAERGGEERCSVGERLLIERAAAAAMICRAVERYVLRTGIMVDGELSSVLVKGYGTHSENLRRALLALNLRPDTIERLRDASAIVAEQATSDAVPEAEREETAA